MTSIQLLKNKSGITIVELLAYVVLSGILITLITSIMFSIIKSAEVTTKISNTNMATSEIINSLVKRINQFSPQGVIVVGEEMYDSGTEGTDNYESAVAWKNLLCQPDSKNCLIIKRYEGYYQNADGSLTQAYCDGTNNIMSCTAIMSAEIIHDDTEDKNYLRIIEHVSSTSFVKYDSNNRYLNASYFNDVTQNTHILTISTNYADLQNDDTFFSSIPHYYLDGETQKINNYLITLKFTFKDPDSEFLYSLLIENKVIKIV